MTKTTLLTAASLAAIALAGMAQAGEITAAVGTTTPIAASAAAPFRIAAERTAASTSTDAGGFVVTNELDTPLTVVDGTTQNYRVTFTVANGTIASSSLVALDGATPVGTVAGAGSTATSATFIVTVQATGADVDISAFQLTTTLTSPSETSVTASSLTELLAGGVATTVDTTAATTLVTYANAIGGFSVTSNTVEAQLSDFKTFSPAYMGNTGAAELATNFTILQNAGAFYAGLSGPTPATVTPASIIASGSLAITGGSQLNVLIPTLTGVTGTPVRTASSATFAIGNADIPDFVSTTVGTPDFILTQPTTAVAIQPASFSAVFTPTAASGYTLSAFSSVDAGDIELDGENFIAPWISGSQAPSTTVIRLTSTSGVASGPVSLSLNNAVARAPGVTTGPGAPIANQTCATGTKTVPATGDLQIAAAELDACFPGGFLRGDLIITVQSDGASLTAKARTVRSDGTFETTLGRYSGSTEAGASF